MQPDSGGGRAEVNDRKEEIADCSGGVDSRVFRGVRALWSGDDSSVQRDYQQKFCTTSHLLSMEVGCALLDAP